MENLIEESIRKYGKILKEISETLSCGGCGKWIKVYSKYSCNTCGRMLCSKCRDYCKDHKLVKGKDNV